MFFATLGVIASSVRRFAVESATPAHRGAEAEEYFARAKRLIGDATATAEAQSSC
jgi:hypothetical protein